MKRNVVENFFLPVNYLFRNIMATRIKHDFVNVVYSVHHNFFLIIMDLFVFLLEGAKQ